MNYEAPSQEPMGGYMPAGFKASARVKAKALCLRAAVWMMITAGAALAQMPGSMISIPSSVKTVRGVLDSLNVSGTYDVEFWVDSEGGGRLVAAANGVQTEAPGKISVNKGDSAVFTTVRPNPQAGWKISEWTLNGNTVKNDDNTPRTNSDYTLRDLSGPARVTVAFEPIVYTVSFKLTEDDVGLWDEIKDVTHGQDAGARLAVEPALPGYRFIRWSEDISNVTKDMTVFGIWDRIKEDGKKYVHFYRNDTKNELIGIEEVDSNTVIPDNEVPDIARFGFNCASGGDGKCAWYRNPGGTDAFDIKNTPITDDIDLYPKWELDTDLFNSDIAGEGNSTDPYIINGAKQLAYISLMIREGDPRYPTAFYRLDGDIDLSPYGGGFNGGKGWIPVGGREHPFSGDFDGDKKTVRGLYINDNALDYAGLFGYIDRGVVKSVGVEGVEITARHNVGGLAGALADSGWAGRDSVQGRRIFNCYVIGNVTGTGDNVGGIAGVINDSAVAARSDTAGFLSAGLENSYAYVRVKGNDNVGGLVGRLGGNCRVRYSYSIGKVEGGRNVGGAVGRASGNGNNPTSGLSNNTHVNKCAALVESVTGADPAVSGRVVGLNEGADSKENLAFEGMDVSWNVANSSSSDKNGGNINFVIISRAMTTINARFLEINGWTTDSVSLPGLFGSLVELPDYLIFEGDDEHWYLGDINADTFYISNATELVELAEIVNGANTLIWGSEANTFSGKTVALKGNIDLSDYGAGFNGGKGWVPIGIYNTNTRFEGIFDGGGNTVSNLYINDAAVSYIGLFGRIDSGGTVKNLTVTGIDITGEKYVGGIAGQIAGGSKIENCSSHGKVHGVTVVGGVVGYVNGDGNRVSNSYSDAEVKGTESDWFRSDGIGGIAGKVISGSIINCNFTGNVEGIFNVGGIAGNLYHDDYDGDEAISEVVDSYSSGRVKGIRYVGGIVGLAIRNAVGSSEVAVTNSYSSGVVEGDDDVGGVAGVVITGARVENCAALNPSVTGTGVNIGRVTGRSVGVISEPLYSGVPLEGLLSDNAAFAGMTGYEFSQFDASGLDGADISAENIRGDGAIGGRFIEDNGWSVANGSLPGFGSPVDMPCHLAPEGCGDAVSAPPSAASGSVAGLAVVTPVAVTLSNGFTAGPNPAPASAGVVSIYRSGPEFSGRTLLAVYNSSGRMVRRIVIRDAGGPGGRVAGAWDLRDSRGRAVPRGTYLARGTVLVNGKREKVSLLIGVK